MNDFDQMARLGAKLTSHATVGWVFARMAERMRFSRWLDSQSTPRPGEPDRRCDTIAELIDSEGTSPPWCAVMEFFTTPDPDAVDRAIEYLGRFRRDLRHGPYERDRYPFAVALIFLTGASGVTGLDMHLPGMDDVGLWFGPRVLDLSAEDAVAHLERIEENKLAKPLLVWSSLMQGGQREEFVTRWRIQAEREPDEELRKTVADGVLLFSQLTDSEAIWKKGLEGMIVKESNFGREIRVEARVQTRREDTLEALTVRFAGELPLELVERIQKQTDLAKLGEWHKLAITSPSLEAFAASLH